MADRARFVGTLAAVTVAYVIAGMLGLSLAFVNAQVTAVWPPAGIAVAALLVLGVRAWPAAAAGAFITNVITTQAIVPSLAIAAGNTLAYVVAAVLTARFARGRHAFEHGSDLLRFTAFSAVLAPVVAATVGTFTLRAADLAVTADAWMVWLTWWLGDATGIVLFAPLCVLWTMRPAPTRAGRVETAALAATLALVLYAVFGLPAALQQDLPLIVLMVPLLLWSASRFDPRTTSLLGVAMSVIAIYRSLQQLGPFTMGGPSVSLLVGQSIVALTSLLMLLMAVETAVRRRVEGELRLLNEALEERVAERTAELTRVHDRLLEAQSVAHVGSWEWDIAADALWWSDELCHVFGVTQPPADYRTYLSLVHPHDRERTDTEVGRTLRTGQPFSFDQRIVRPDGELRVIQARGRVELDAAGHPTRLLGAGLDITERIHAEEARAQLIGEQTKLREAEETNRAKDAFLATLSHELRTPLNAALGWAHILRSSMRADGRDDRVVQAIHRNLLIQSRLVSDILDVSRITKGELPLNREQVEMTAVFHAALEMVRDAAATRDLTIEISSAGSSVVAGDGGRLQQVAWNLLSNAVKFAAERGRVTVTIVEGAEGVACTVEDDGPGIAPAFLPHVFDPFSQADSTATREHGGLGLGLAIAREIVAMHRGTISAGNRTNGGAVFVVRLPRADTPGTPGTPGGAGAPVGRVVVES